MAGLKVFRTAIGFHDAYVAAPSRKAALAAWGSDKDLFARGAAEQVTDPQLMKAPLASPGKVVRRLRGTEAEQIAALPPDRPRAKAKVPPASKPAARPRQPRPSRDDLTRAEEAVAAAEARQAAALAELAEREQRLAQERRALQRDQARERERLTRDRDRADEAYRNAIREWEG